MQRWWHAMQRPIAGAVCERGAQLAMARTGLAGAARGNGGSPPPASSWKLYENPFYDGLAAAVAAAASAAAAAAAMAGKQQRLTRIDEDDDETEDEKQASALLPGRVPSPMPGSYFWHGRSQGEALTDVTQAGVRRQGFRGDGRSSRELKGRGRATMKAGHGAAQGGAQLHCKESAVFGEEASGLLLQKPISLPSSCTGTRRIESPRSPCSHLQPRPPSSASDSPCCSKPIKAPKVSTRIPYLSRNSQPISPPLRTIALMRPISACDGLGMQNPALKSGSSSLRSSGQDDDVELLFPCTKKYNLVDADIITSPRDYLKAANKPSGLFQGKRMDSSPVVAALSKELKRAMTRVHELEHFQTSARKEVDGLLRRFADEKAFLKTREEGKIQAAIFWIQEELDKERKLRKKMELENRKLSRSLEEANRTVVKAEEELDKEKKARQLMEDVCDELAREIGEDKAEVEELKREHARAREEIEEERRTLQLTEAWREERVQMKLSDAKSELEERCVALDKLKLELEMFLNTRQAHGGEADHDNQGENLRTATEKLKSEASSFMPFLESGTTHGGQFQDDMLSSDDIQSLRLSRDNIRSQSEWTGYTDVSIRDGPKWAINHAREFGKGITTASDIENESTKILSKFYANPNGQENLSWFSPKPISMLAKDKQPIAGLEGKFNYLRFDGNDSGEERSLDEENEAEDDSDTTWGHNKFGPNQTEKSKWNVKVYSNMNGFEDDIDDGGDGSGQDRDSGASPSPEFSRRCSKQRAFKGTGMHLNEGFFRAGKKQFYRNLLEFSRPCTDDLDGASSVNGLSSPIYEHSGDTLDLNLQREDWPVVPVYGSASQGRRLAIANNTASRRRKNPLQWRKVSSKIGDLQSSTVLDDGKSVLYLQARHRKGPRPTR